ncbi:FAD binding domain-containing protein [Methylomonas rapida]|uniref:FAD binding domain-containing protein n=1 Tax=Methylomonas rapida TaxID=2963939 RepID=A0ABY7GFZ2_9GAMM|nr:FAD binding domain-containing protein [Methylomonas rapida]WAR44187.1 FAD binding domain-containing protein [Methylomonas rapida]
MSIITFLLNQTVVTERTLESTPLLDILRGSQHLTGCKEGCREGDCGACLVLLGTRESGKLVYRPATACLVPLGALAGWHVVTIEGLSGTKPNPIQQALVEQGGIQCGFCSPGIVVALTAFFLNSPTSEVDAALEAVAGNLCRCTGYAGIKRAIQQLCEQFDLARSQPAKRLDDCLQWRLLPAYFADIEAQLASLPAPTPAVSQTKETGILVAGGTDLMVHQAKTANAANLQFLPRIADQDCIRLDGERCRIAAGTTIEQLRTSPVLQELLPSIAEDLQLLCSAPIRQHATLGGNLANASPIADLAVFFLALDAELILEKRGSRRRLPLREFFLAYKQTALQSGERIAEIAVNVVASFSFEKVCKRMHLDIASVNSALSIGLANGVIDHVHLAAGGVAPLPLYLATVCDYLRGKAINAKTVLAAAAIAQTEIAPIGDLRGSIEYKRLLFRQLFFAHFLKLFPELIRWEDLHALG